MVSLPDIARRTPASAITTRPSGPFMAVVALLAIALLDGCVMSATDRVAVRIDGEPWTVVMAPDDGRGMRGRVGFDGADGMLFDQGRDVDPTAVVFVMDGVSIPLDIAWFSTAGGLVGLTSMEPCPAEPCPRYEAPAPFRWAIEAPSGAFDGLTPGSRLTLESGD